LLVSANGPGLKPDFAWLLFRSLKATAPSASLTLKRQGSRFAQFIDTPERCGGSDRIWRNLQRNAEDRRRREKLS